MLVDLQCWDAGDDDAPKQIADDGRWSLTDSNTHLQFGCCWRRDVPAGVVKSVDTQDLGSCDESRGVQVPPPAPPESVLLRSRTIPAAGATCRFRVGTVFYPSREPCKSPKQKLMN